MPNDGDVSEYEPEIDTPHLVASKTIQMQATAREDSPEEMRVAMSSSPSRQDIVPLQATINPFNSHLDLSLDYESDSANVDTNACRQKIL